MGLCKDCFHREVCESWTTINLDDIPPEIPCGHFKDTADVAPREEVAREIFEEIRDLIRFTMEPYSTTLYAKIEFEKLEALKKKYTQSEPPEGE